MGGCGDHWPDCGACEVDGGALGFHCGVCDGVWYMGENGGARRRGEWKGGCG